MNHPLARLARRFLPGGLALWVAWSGAAMAADLAEAKRLYLAGDYPASVALARKAVPDWRDAEEWPLVLAQGLLAMGKYPEARAAITNALAHDSDSVRLRWLAHEVFQSNGDTNAASTMLEEMARLVATRTWAFRDAPNLVVLGRAALLQGADPKRVLERLFDRSRWNSRGRERT